MGSERDIAFGGKRGVYRGSSRDHYADGTTILLLSLELFGMPWLPDARDRSFHALGDHCVRIVDAAEDRVDLEVALQAEHEYDSWRCQMGCCAPGASRTPDGTDECCFCSDAPAR